MLRKLNEATWGTNLANTAHRLKIVEPHEKILSSYESPSHNDLEDVGHKISRLVSLIVELPKRFFGNEVSRYAKEIGFSDFIYEAINNFGESLTSNTFVRGDLTHQGELWKLLELNVGNAVGGLFYASLPRLAGYNQKYDVLRDWAKETTKGWKHGSNAAIVEDIKYIDYIKRLAPVMANEISKYSGGKTFIIGCDEVEFNGSHLVWKETKENIDEILPVFSELHLAENPQYYTPMMNAIKFKKARCRMGPISRLIANKGNLALLYELLKLGKLNNLESELIKTFIPYTIWVSHETRDTLVKNKNEWVMKPITGFCGYGVVVGKETTSQEWEQKINFILKKGIQKTYIAQQYIPPRSSRTLLIGERGEREERVSQIIWGIFIFGKRYLGTFIRANKEGDSAVINHLTNAAIGPLPFHREMETVL